MTQLLREAFEREVDDVPAFGDIDQAIREAEASRHRRILVVGVAASVALVVALAAVASGALGERALPATPQPSPSENVLNVVMNSDTIAAAPLAGGAEVAQIRADATVWSGSQARIVARSFRIYQSLLSPDGRLVATVITDDILLVTDVTTGERVLRWKIWTSDGYRGQSPRLVWSADSSRLFQVVIETGAKGRFGQPKSAGELKVWEFSAEGTAASVADPIPLPGGLIGVSPGGGEALVNSAADRSGTLVTLNVSSGRWTESDVASAPVDVVVPSSEYQASRGQGCWSPDGRYVCWVGRFKADGTLRSDGPWQVAWLDQATGTWTQRDVTADYVQFTGWRGDDPMVLISGPGTVQVAALVPDGVEILKTYGIPASPSGDPRGITSTSVATSW